MTRICLAMAFLMFWSCMAANLTDGLLAWYDFEGDAQDGSGYNRHGTVNGAQLTTDRFGVEDGAYLFDGENDYIVVEDDNDLRLYNTDFTLCAWVYETARNTGYQDAIMAKRGTGQLDGWFFSLTGLQSGSGAAIPGRILYQVSGGYDPHILSDQVASLGMWYHIVVTYDNGADIAKIYINGAMDTSLGGMPSPGPACDSGLCIGKDSAGQGYFFHGKLDDLRIYNRILSDAEIAQLFDPGGALESPENLALAEAGGMITLSWDAVPNALSYNIYASPDPDLPPAGWTVVANVGGTQWTVPAQESKFYLVTAVR